MGSTFHYMNKAVLHLKMDMASHDVSNVRTLDVSGNGNHAIFGDGATPSTYPTKTEKRGYDFDGVNSYLEMGSNVLFDSTRALSVFAMASIDDWSPAYPHICNLKTDQTTGFVFLLSNQPSYLGICIGSSANFLQRRTTIDLSPNLLVGDNHVGFVFNGVNRTATESYKIYFNGKEYAHSSSINFAVTPNSNFVGKSNAANHFLNGKITDFRIFNQALTPLQIQDLYIQSQRLINKV